MFISAHDSLLEACIGIAHHPREAGCEVFVGLHWARKIVVVAHNMIEFSTHLCFVKRKKMPYPEVGYGILAMIMSGQGLRITSAGFLFFSIR